MPPVSCTSLIIWLERDNLFRSDFFAELWGICETRAEKLALVVEMAKIGFGGSVRLSNCF